MKYPSNGLWTVGSGSDRLGAVHTSHNFNFDRPGYARLNGRPVALYTTADDGDLGYLLQVLFYEDVYQWITDDGIFEFDPVTLAVTQNTTSGVPTLGLMIDAETFNGYMYVASTNNLKKWNGTAWSGNLLALTTDVPHVLCRFENLNYLAAGYANTVKLLNTSDSVVNTLTIPSEYWVTSMRWRQNNLYIGTKEIYGGEAKVFIWNGQGSSAQIGHGVKSNWIFSMEDFDSSMCVITNAGQLLRYDGGGFAELASFPVYTSQRIWQDGQNGLELNGKVFNRGMRSDGKRLHICIDGSISAADVNSNPAFNLIDQPSGLWTYDKDVGLYPRSSGSTDKYTLAGISSVSSSLFTVGTPNNLQTGEPVLVTNAGSLTGITAGITYHAVVVSSTTFYLSLTREDADAGVYLTISGTAGAAEVAYLSYRIVGERYAASQGAVAVVSPNAAPMRTIFGGNIMFGTRGYAPDRGSSIAAVCTISNAANYGFIETSRTFSNVVNDSTQKVVVRFDGMRNSVDGMTVRVKAKEYPGIPTSIPLQGAWVNATTITNNNAETSWRRVREGDEIFIVNGRYSGRSATVLSAELTGNNMIVQISESFGTVGEISDVLFDRFVDVGVVESDSTTIEDGYAEFPILTSNVSPSMRAKVEVRGEGISIIDVDIVSTPNKKI